MQGPGLHAPRKGRSRAAAAAPHHLTRHYHHQLRAFDIRYSAVGFRVRPFRVGLPCLDLTRAVRPSHPLGLSELVLALVLPCRLLVSGGLGNPTLVGIRVLRLSGNSASLGWRCRVRDSPASTTPRVGRWQYPGAVYGYGVGGAAAVAASVRGMASSALFLRYWGRGAWPELWSGRMAVLGVKW
jgi:hypothetical protein